MATEPTLVAAAPTMTGAPGRTDDEAPGLPGAVGISLLRVYSQTAKDTVVGGTPHVHLVCSEGYYVIGGTGAVSTLTRAGSAMVPLIAGSVTWFTPGTVHRLVNDGDLEILTLMQNGGLPEAGDAVLTFPSAILEDPEHYDRLSKLRPDATIQDAFRRRDLAVDGLHELQAAVDRDGHAALESFYQAAAEIVRPRLQRWRALWEKGARRSAQDTADQIDRLHDSDVSYLLDASVETRSGPVETGRLGMCGVLEVYPTPAHEEA